MMGPGGKRGGKPPGGTSVLVIKIVVRKRKEKDKWNYNECSGWVSLDVTTYG